MSDQEALLKFCAAQRDLTRLDDATSAQRRQHARSASTFRDLLKEQMVSANASCVPVMCGGKQKYAILRRSATGSAVSCETIMKTLRELRYDAQHASVPPTIEEWVERALRLAMTNGTEQRPPTLAIVAKRPEVEPKTVHPASMSRIQETMDSLHTASEASKTLRKRDDVRRRELRAVCKEVEESVANHLTKHDPEHGTRRVRLVHGSSEATYYLRRKSTARSSRPTVRTALPAVRQTIRRLREEAGVDAHPSWDSFRWLTSPATLLKLERHVGECLRRMHTEKTTSRVVLTSV